jgi:hypothetical protein
MLSRVSTSVLLRTLASEITWSLITRAGVTIRAWVAMAANAYRHAQPRCRI